MPAIEHVVLKIVGYPAVNALCVFGEAGKPIQILILKCFGLSKLGPVAGGIAAKAQAYLGNVLRNSYFAKLQSLAMGGSPAMSPVIPVIIVGLAGAYLVYVYADDLKKVTPWHVVSLCKEKGTEVVELAKDTKDIISSYLQNWAAVMIGAHLKFQKVKSISTIPIEVVKMLGISMISVGVYDVAKTAQL